MNSENQTVMSAIGRRILQFIVLALALGIFAWYIASVQAMSKNKTDSPGNSGSSGNSGTHTKIGKAAKSNPDSKSGKSGTHKNEGKPRINLDTKYMPSSKSGIIRLKSKTQKTDKKK
jgi:hypothetical protein